MARKKHVAAPPTPTFPPRQYATLEDQGDGTHLAIFWDSIEDIDDDYKDKQVGIYELSYTATLRIGKALDQEPR